MIVLYLISVIFVGYVSLYVNANNLACDGPDWVYRNQMCYKIFSDKVKWSIAEYKCFFMRAHHISVHDMNDNEFITNLAKKVDAIWLGAAQFGASKNYVWSDRTSFVFENWKGSLRPTHHRGKKCSKLDTKTGKWHQSCCKIPASYICQKKALRSLGSKNPLSNAKLATKF